MNNIQFKKGCVLKRKHTKECLKHKKNLNQVKPGGAFDSTESEKLVSKETSTRFMRSGCQRVRMNIGLVCPKGQRGV
jgi:hypothetical protein